MKHTLVLYKRLVGIQVRSQLQYRVSFLMEAVSSAITLGLFFVSLVLVFERFDNLGGWTLAEVAFLTGMVEVGFGVMDMVFSGFDPSTFGQQVRRGTFDQILLRPVDATVQVFGSDFVLRRLGRIAQGVAILVYALLLLDMAWTPAKIVYLPVVLFSQVIFFGGLFIIGSTITFWTVQSIEAVNIFTYGGSELISYPMNIYPAGIRRFFTFVLPAIFINYFPALFFLDKSAPFPIPDIAPFLAPVAGGLVLGASLLFWRYGMRHYQSTGT